MNRVSKEHNHTLKVKGICRAWNASDGSVYSKDYAQLLRRRSRPQRLWMLHMAGDWHPAYEMKTPPPKPHMMRVMLVSNLAVDERFANGTQGRLLMWHPGATENKRRALPAYCPDLLTRFCKEGALAKVEMLPDADHMDVGARQENLAVRGEPILLQL